MGGDFTAEQKRYLEGRHEVAALKAMAEAAV